MFAISNFKLKLAAISVTVALAGCSSVQTSEETVATSGTTSEYAQFQNDRPESKSLAIGNESVDMTFNSIAGIYTKTTALTDSYIEQTEASPTALKLNKLQEVQGKEAFEAALVELSETERQEYDKYLTATSEITEQSLGLLVEAYKLQGSFKEIDIKALIGNPMKLPAAMKAANLAKDQILFSVDALAMLKKYHDINSNAKSYSGR